MRLVRFGAFAAAALLTTQQASAQSLHGIRAEADVGIDRFYSEGNHDNHVGWGGEIGADFDLGGSLSVRTAASGTRALRTSRVTGRGSPIANRSRNGALASALVA
jgi:outer membrane immunogenic protein